MYIIPPSRFEIIDLFCKVFYDACFDLSGILLSQGDNGMDMPGVPTIAIRIHQLREFFIEFQEAAEYFHIGEKKMRQIADESMGANFLPESGNRVMIERRLFEEFLNRASVI